MPTRSSTANGGRQPRRPTPGLGKQIYQRCNVIQWSFSTFKQWRGIASRRDKLAITSRGGIVLRANTIWLKDSRDVPATGRPADPRSGNGSGRESRYRRSLMKTGSLAMPKRHLTRLRMEFVSRETPSPRRVAARAPLCDST
ncbi:MAG: transposase [Salinibacterium sp.]|nr:transposase [Salinibacterium sp.]